MSRRLRALLPGFAVVVLFALPLLPEILGIAASDLPRRADHPLAVAARGGRDARWPREVPFVDARGVGRPAAARQPNAVLLYPTFLLERVLPPEAAFNLHYLAPRALGVLRGAGARAPARPREGAAFVAGVAFAFSGMMLSFGSAFMNSSAAAAWLPWCAAAALDLGAGADGAERRRAGAALGPRARAAAPGGRARDLAPDGRSSRRSLLAAPPLAAAPRGQERPAPADPRVPSARVAASGALALALAAPLLLPLRQVFPLTYRGQHLYLGEGLRRRAVHRRRAARVALAALRRQPGPRRQAARLARARAARTSSTSGA